MSWSEKKTKQDERKPWNWTVKRLSLTLEKTISFKWLDLKVAPEKWVASEKCITWLAQVPLLCPGFHWEPRAQLDIESRVLNPGHNCYINLYKTQITGWNSQVVKHLLARAIWVPMYTNYLEVRHKVLPGRHLYALKVRMACLILIGCFQRNLETVWITPMQCQIN